MKKLVLSALVVFALIAMVPLPRAQTGPRLGLSPQVFILRSDGSGLRQVTSAPGWKSRPTWSRDGSRLAYGWNGIHVFTIASGRDRVLRRARRLGRPSSPVWSPGRDEILLEAGYGDEDHPRTAIALIRADGSRPRTLTSYPSWRYPLGGPTWSPDGRRIAYLREHRQRIVPPKDPLQPIALGGPLDVAAIGRRGGGGWTARVRGDEDLPSWSPDGRWILFVRRTDRGRTLGVWKVSAAGRRPERVGRGIQNAQATWSPDSQQLAFTGHVAGPDRQQHLYVLDARRTATPRKIVAEVGASAWSPVQDLIAFADFEGRLRVTAPNGSAQRVLATFASDTEFRYLTWSPDGGSLAFTAEKQRPSD